MSKEYQDRWNRPLVNQAVYHAPKLGCWLCGDTKTCSTCNPITETFIMSTGYAIRGIVVFENKVTIKVDTVGGDTVSLSKRLVVNRY